MWHENLEIVPDAYVITYFVVIEELDPIVPDKFPVRHQTVYAIGAKKPDKTLDQIDPFLGIRIALLVQHLEQQRESHSFVSYPKHENIDIGLAKLPIGPVDTEL